jgi:pimeloyl-ACP methyl ester carboxylesterase
MAWPGLAPSLTEVELESLTAAKTEEGALAWCEHRYGADGSGFAAAIEELGTGGGIGAADEAYLDEPGVLDAILITMAEAFRQGVVGMAGDLHIEATPWAFDLASITAPVELVHGDEDAMAPLAHANHTAELVPSAPLTILPGVGHLSLLPHLAEVAARIAPR